MLDAVIDIFEGGDLDPGIDEISEKSGVSNRSIYRYFHQRDELIRAAMWRAMARIQPEMTLDDLGVGELGDRIARFVQHRLEMYAALAPLTRAARRAAQSEPMIGEEFEAGRLVLRRQFLDQFAPELERLTAGERTRLVTAAEMAFQFESFEYLHHSCAERDMISEILVEQLTFYLDR
ncbi:MAG: TetR/AcrR family transcriptional regulator [Ilumatobacteraceae bacterium]